MSGRWPGYSVRYCGCVPGRGWSNRGWCRSTGGSTRTAALMRIVSLSRSRGRSWPRPGRAMRPRMSYRGDELPEELRTPEGRREFFRQTTEQLRCQGERSELSEDPEEDVPEEVALEFDPARIVAPGPGTGGLVAGRQAPARAPPLAAPGTNPASPARSAAVGGPAASVRARGRAVPTRRMSTTRRRRATDWGGG